MKSVSRNLKVSLFAITLLWLVGGIWFYRKQEAQLRNRVEAELLSIASLKVNQIHRWRNERLDDALVLSQMLNLPETVAQWFDDPKPGATEFILSTLRTRAIYNHYSDVILVDTTGAIRLSVSGKPIKFSPTLLQALQQALLEKRPVISELDSTSSNGLPCINIIAPLVPYNIKSPCAIGAVILEAEVHNFLYPLIQSWPVPSRTSETVLVRRDGDYALILNDLRFDRNAALHLKFPVTQAQIPAVMAVLGEQGVFTGKDYRGVNVYSAILPVPESNWKIIAKIDTSEAMSEWRHQSILILGIFFLLLLGIGVAAYIAWQSDQQTRLRELYQTSLALNESESRYSTTLLSIGDGVIATDASGKVTLLNPIAEQLTGWSQADAKGRSIEEVFKIVNESSRDVVQNPIHRVLKEGVIVGLANHTILISRNGEELPIADSGAPIRNANGDLIGVVLVFRDVTQSHRYLHERETTLKLLQLINDPSQTHDLIRNILALLQEWFRFDSVGLRLRRGDEFPYFEYQGFSAEFIQAENSICGKDQFGNKLYDAEGQPILECMCGDILYGRFDPSQPYFTPNGSFWTNGTSELGTSKTEHITTYGTRGRCTADGYESIGIFPLRFGDRVLGLLQMNDHKTNRFTPGSVTFIESITDQIAIALAMRETQDALAESENTYRSLFENMLNGFSYCQMIYENERPVDFIYLDVNKAFEHQTGLKDVQGKRVSEVIPGILEADPELIARYGRVATTQEHDKFEIFVEALKMWFEVSVYSPEKGYFVAIFDAITERKLAEEALVESEAKFRNLVESLRNEYFFYRHDRNRVFNYVSPSVTTVLGYSITEFMTDSTKFFTPNPLNLKSDTYTALSLQGIPQPAYEIEVYHKNGSIKKLAVSESPIVDKSGNIVGIEGIAHDITELKQAEEALREQKEFFEQMFTQSSVSTQILDKDGWCERINPKLSEIFGVKPENIEGHLYNILRDEGVKQGGVLPHLERVFNEGKTAEWEVHFDIGLASESTNVEVKEKKKVWYYNWSYPIFDSNGKLKNVIVQHSDITERKRANQALKDSEERFRGLFENASVGLYHTSTDGKVLLANKAFLKLVGCNTFEDLEKRSIEHRGYFNEADAKEFIRLIESGGTVSGFESTWRYSDGSPVYVRESARLVRDSDGNRLFYEGIVEDISEWKKAEEQNEKLEHQLLHAQKMEAVGRLAGGVAHDFNNMLLAILGNAELALNELDATDPISEYLKEIEKAGRRSADLTHQLLAFARKQTVNPIPVDLNVSVSGMLKMLRRLIGEDLSLLWKPGHEVWNVKIDPSQIDQVLANLAVNSRDAIKGVGKITIETANVTFDQEYLEEHPGTTAGDYVMLAVSDDGCGMDTQTKERIFEPFFTTKELGKGTGMGLATVFGIVKQNRGFIYVYSELGQGTTFKIYLPRSTTTATELVEDTNWLGLAGGSETILLVEDEPAILGIGMRMLNLLGYRTITAGTPEDALRIAVEYKGRIDLLLTDVIMPGMNGRVLAEKFLALRPETKTLFMSGYTANAIAHHNVLDEGISFLPKPFTVKSLSQKVRESLVS